jgi:hypothetical protein
MKYSATFSAVLGLWAACQVSAIAIGPLHKHLARGANVTTHHRRWLNAETTCKRVDDPPAPPGNVPYEALPESERSKFPPPLPPLTPDEAWGCLWDRASHDMKGSWTCNNRHYLTEQFFWSDNEDCVNSCKDCVRDSVAKGYHVIGCETVSTLAKCMVGLEGGEMLLDW